MTLPIASASDFYMPRLSVYIPDHLANELREWSGKVNVSKVCAAALRAEVAARAGHRSIEGLFDRDLPIPSDADHYLMRRFRLRRAVVSSSESTESPRDAVAYRASRFLEESFAEGMRVALGGGSQMWEVVRQLRPRNVGIQLWALGFGNVDHEAPHVHPNALVTLLSLMYGTRTRPMLVGAPHFERTWSYPAVFPPSGVAVQRLIVGSCAIFDADSPYARVLGIHHGRRDRARLVTVTFGAREVVSGPAQ